MASQHPFSDAKRIVIKIGTSTLTYESGRLNIRHIESVIRALSDIKNSGKEIIFVSSGAIAVGVGKLGLPRKPSDIGGRQACAAVGQCELMSLYSKLFLEYGQTAGQVLMTRDIIDDILRKQNAFNTFARLLDLGAIPVVNENDTVSTEEIEFGDNDALSAMVAVLTGAQALIILTDIEGVYDGNPKDNPTVKLISHVTEIDNDLLKKAGGRGSSRGTGGMVTKIEAASIAMENNIPAAIIDGRDIKNLYRLIDGKDTGTIFLNSN